MKSHEGSILTFSGQRIWPLEPDPKKIHLVDIAHHLSNLCRYTGAVSIFYSVGEHSIRMADYIDEEFKSWALLHDASEAYLQDLPAPIKHMPEMKPYRDAEERMMEAVAKRFDLPCPEPPEVSYLDQAIRVNEMRDLKGRKPRNGDPKPLLMGSIIPWNPRSTKKLFLEFANNLGIK